jgi:ribosomal protein S18 acetylase RimI-like enzyme
MEPLAAYLVYREGKPPLDSEKWLISRGFTHSTKLERYAAKQIIGELSCDGISTASTEETYAMLSELFSKEEMDLPCRDMFRDGAICVRGNEGVSGVICDMGHTRIIAVHPSVRGQGIGGRLYRAYVAQALSDSKGSPVFNEWIRHDNTASIAMFRKLGFCKSTLVTDCYISGRE